MQQRVVFWNMDFYCYQELAVTWMILSVRHYKSQFHGSPLHYKACQWNMQPLYFSLTLPCSCLLGLSACIRHLPSPNPSYSPFGRYGRNPPLFVLSVSPGQYHRPHHLQMEGSIYRSKCNSIPRTGISCTWCFLSFCSKNCKSTFLR